MLEQLRGSKKVGRRALGGLAVLALAAGLLLPVQPAQAEQKTCSWGREDGSGTDWTSDNWGPEQCEGEYPNNNLADTYDAIVTQCCPALNADVVLTSLVLERDLYMKENEDGEPQSYDLTVEGSFSWGGSANHRGPGTTTVNGGLVIQGSNKALSNRTLQLYGNTGWSAGGLWFNNAIVDNAPGSNFTISDDLTLAADIDSVFDNFGTVTSTALDPESEVRLSILFNNSGLLESGHGTILLTRGGVHTGRFATHGDATIHFAGGTHELDTSEVSEANLLIGLDSAGSLKVQSDFVNTGGTKMTMGELSGPRTYTEHDTFHWRGGSMIGGGITVAEGELLINGSARTVGRWDDETRHLHILNGARWDADDGDNLHDSLWLYGGCSILNGSGSTFDIQRSDAWIRGGGSGALDAWFDNYGVFLKSGRGEAGVGVAFNNRDEGRVDCEDGALRLMSGGIHEGLLTTEGGDCQIELGGSTHTLRTDDDAQADLLLSGVVEAELDFANDGGTELTGTLAGASKYTEKGEFIWPEGRQAGNGTTYTGGQLRLDSGNKYLGSLDETRGLIIQGNAIWPPAPGFQDSLNVYPDSYILLESTFDIQRDDAFIRRAGLGGDFTKFIVGGDSGILKKSGEAGMSRIEIPVENREGGTVQVEQGTLSLSSTDGFENGGNVIVLASATLSALAVVNLEAGGVLAGHGTIDAPVVNEGRMTHGLASDPIGILTIDSDYTEVPGGGGALPGVFAGIAGTVQGEEYGAFHVTDTATLAGMLAVRDLGYTPEVGDRFEVLRAETIEGCFSQIDIDDFGGAELFAYYQRSPLEDDKVVIQAMNPGAAPDDLDGDGVLDREDNCADFANPDQTDTNSDGFGNICDPDFDDNGIIGISDFAAFRRHRGESAGDPGYDAVFDMNSDGTIDLTDFSLWLEYFNFRPGHPGPSGLCCAGEDSCTAAG